MIKVIDNWVLDADSHQYIIGKLGKYKNKKTNEMEEYIQDPSYYTSICDALCALTRRYERDAVKESNGDLKTLYEAVQASHKRLENAIAKAFPELKIVEVKSNG